MIYNDIINLKSYLIKLMNIKKKYLTSSEYNKNKESIDSILNKLFNVSIIEVEKLLTIQEIAKEQNRRIEEISKPLTNKPIIN